MVKNIGPQLARVSGIAGATVLGTGEIVLIINPVQLARAADVQRADTSAERARAAHVGDERRASRDHRGVVDDSLTVRKVTQRLLVREGFEVLRRRTASTRSQVLAERRPTSCWSTSRCRAWTASTSPRTSRPTDDAHIPIIMITSRTAEKHRNRAAELGVDVYLGKPYQEDELLRHLRDMLSLPTPA